MQEDIAETGSTGYTGLRLVLNGDERGPDNPKEGVTQSRKGAKSVFGTDVTDDTDLKGTRRVWRGLFGITGKGALKEETRGLISCIQLPSQPSILRCGLRSA